MIFLHGLLGRGKNWRSIAQDPKVSISILYCIFKQINGLRHCHLVDLRNHGDSDHSDSMSYREMAEDVVRYADEHNIERFTVLGHSMGGKTVMTLAGLHPNRLDGVVVIDAPPEKGIRDGNNKTVELVIMSARYIADEAEGLHRDSTSVAFAGYDHA